MLKSDPDQMHSTRCLESLCRRIATLGLCISGSTERCSTMDRLRQIHAGSSCQSQAPWDPFLGRCTEDDEHAIYHKADPDPRSWGWTSVCMSVPSSSKTSRNLLSVGAQAGLGCMTGVWDCGHLGIEPASILRTLIPG